MKTMRLKVLALCVIASLLLSASCLSLQPIKTPYQMGFEAGQASCNVTVDMVNKAYQTGYTTALSTATKCDECTVYPTKADVMRFVVVTTLMLISTLYALITAML